MQYCHIKFITWGIVYIKTVHDVDLNTHSFHAILWGYSHLQAAEFLMQIQKPSSFLGAGSGPCVIKCVDIQIKMSFLHTI